MSKKEFWPVALFFLGVAILFFNPFFRRGFLPFPGDLLVGHYAPWNASSFLGFAPGGVPHKAQGIDVIRQLFPWRYFSTQMLKSGQFPFWNPYNFSGNPHLANFQTGIFYPLSLVFLILPFNLAWSIFILLQPLLACFFTYLFLREIKLSRLGSVFASLAFAYCLYLAVWLEWANIGHTILWLPLALFLIEKIIKELKLKWILLFIFSLASSVLAGYIQTTVYLFAVVYAYFFFRLFSIVDKQEKFSKVAVVLGSGLAALLVCAIQLLPTWEIFRLSAREAYPSEKIPQLLLPWFGLITAFVPDFFGNPASRNYWLPGTYIERVLFIGILPLFFALLAIFFRKKEKTVVFFAVLALLTLALALNWPVARWFHRLQLPIISTTVPTRILWVFVFCLAVLACFGVDYFLAVRKSRKLEIAVGIFWGFYLSFWLFSLVAPVFFPGSWWLVYLSVSQRNLILPTFFAFFGLILLLGGDWLKKRKLALTLVVLVTIFDLFFYFKKITPFSPPEFVFPETEVIEYLKKNAGINRFWGYGSGYVDSNFATITKTYSTDGYDPLFISRYGELISASDNGQIKEPIPRADVVLAGKNPFRQRLLNLLGVKYLLQKNETLDEEWQPDYQTFPSEIYQLVWQKKTWQVYENKTALPRIFLVDRYRAEQDKQKIIDLIFNPEFELDKEIILEENLAEDFVLTGQSSGKVELLDYQPNQLTVKTFFSGNSLLLITDNYFPGWQAKIDGQPTKIYRADYAFRAIPVPQGEHKIIFSYEPQSFKIGKTISGVTLLAILAFSLKSQLLVKRKA